MRRWGLFLVGTLAACASPRPTEFVNITYTPSVDTDDYRTWDFELESCQDLEDPRIDHAFLRVELLAAIEAELAARGYERRTADPVDFTVFYELEVADGDGPADARTRGRIFVRDATTGRLVWRGERKAPRSARELTAAETSAAVRRFASDVLRYTRKLEEPGGQRP